MALCNQRLSSSYHAMISRPNVKQKYGRTFTYIVKDKYYRAQPPPPTTTTTTALVAGSIVEGLALIRTTQQQLCSAQML